jgi:hypothetical protein
VARGDQSHCVLKTHIGFGHRHAGLLTEGTAIIVSERPLEECVTSLFESHHDQMALTGQTTFPCGASLIEAARAVFSASAYADLWRSLPHTAVKFSEVIGDPVGVANKIASKFDLRAVGSTVIDEIEDIWQLRSKKIMELPSSSRDLINFILQELGRAKAGDGMAIEGVSSSVKSPGQQKQEIFDVVSFGRP